MKKILFCMFVSLSMVLTGCNDKEEVLDGGIYFDKSSILVCREGGTFAIEVYTSNLTEELTFIEPNKDVQDITNGYISESKDTIRTDWFTAIMPDKAGNQILIEITPNDSDAQRKGLIELYSGYHLGNIAIFQNNQ